MAIAEHDSQRIIAHRFYTHNAHGAFALFFIFFLYLQIKHAEGRRLVLVIQMQLGFGFVQTDGAGYRCHV